jgi:hypothetical protein
LALLWRELNWIHTIPIPGKAFSEAETPFIHQLCPDLFLPE